MPQVTAQDGTRLQYTDEGTGLPVLCLAGLTRNTALMTHIPLVHQNQDAGFVGDEGWGVEDIDVMLQHRFLQRDLGPLSTQRASVQLGVEVPTFDDFSSDSFDPFVGVAFTQVIQRVGLGAYGRVKLNTGNDDTPTHLGDTRHNAAFFGASALYRVDPPRFSGDENIGPYLVAEVNGVAEADGDYSLWFSPSVMVEAPTWTFEAAVRLPLLEDVGEARELEVGFTLGFRVFF